MRPVLIGGCPRSGTTLLGALLGSHSQCLTIPEFQAKMRVLARLPSDKEGLNADAIIRELFRRSSLELWTLDEAQIRNAVESSSTYREIFDRLVELYGAQRQAGDKSIWIDHSPDNIGLMHSLLRTYPEAKVIHLVRDGRAVINSVLPLTWGPNTPLRGAMWWMAHLSHGLALETKLGPDHIARVHYENLIGDPEPELRRLCDFIGVEFEPKMVEGVGFKGMSDQHRLVGQRPDQSRSQAWRTSLSPRAIELIELRVGELLEYLGYERVNAVQTIPTIWWENFRTDLVELSRSLAINPVRSKLRFRRTLRAQRAQLKG